MSRIVPLIIAFAFFMEMMDSTVIATSLPAIAADIGVGPITLKLAMTSYLVALGIFIPASGWLADKFGAKRIFRLAIIVFVLGSVACAFASSLPEFVLARFLQGIGGSMMTPVGRLVLVRSFRKSEFISAMTLVTIPGLVGPMIGPPLGGFITTYFSWHWIFIINVPIGLLGYILSGFYLPEIAPRATSRLDWTGFMLVGIAAAGIVFGLSVISLPALPPAVGVAATLFGTSALFGYVHHARRADNPILDPALFSNRIFRLTVTGSNLARIAMGAQPFLMPLMLQVGFGLTPFRSGLIMFASAFGAIATKFVAQRLLFRFGFRVLMTAGAVSSGLLTLANMTFGPETPYWYMIAIIFMSGLARSLMFTSANSLTLTSVAEAEASQATAISSVLQQVVLALGVAYAGVVLETLGWWSGVSLTVENFHLAFGATAMLSFAGAVFFWSVPQNAGADVSGHRVASGANA